MRLASGVATVTTGAGRLPWASAAAGSAAVPATVTNRTINQKNAQWDAERSFIMCPLCLTAPLASPGSQPVDVGRQPPGQLDPASASARDFRHHWVRFIVTFTSADPPGVGFRQSSW